MNYTIQQSRRARRVWLRLSDAGELVVVVPRGFDAGKVPGIVAAHGEWIARSMRRLALKRAQSAPAGPVALPSRITLPAIETDWSVHYRATASSRVAAVERGEGMLVVSGAVDDAHRCREALIRWLFRVARRSLLPRLAELAAAEGMVPDRGTFRLQRTRWASCSRSGTVSLNLRLLFVPPELVRHIMLHELCHTVRMDHSARFWMLLARHDPDWREARRRLRAAWRETPAWLTAPLVTRE